MPGSKYFTSIIIPIMNQLEYTKLCLESLYAFTDEECFELIVINNGSIDGSLEYLSDLKKKNLRVLDHKENIGVAPAWNEGIRDATGNIIAILNNDIILTPNWFDNMLRAFDNPHVWCASPLFTRLDIPEDFQETAFAVSQNKPSYLPINHIAGFCFFVRAEAFRQLGLFDEQYKVGWFEDSDFNMRLYNSGHPPVQVENVLIHHFESRTIIQTPDFFDVYPEANAKRFAKKWQLDEMPKGQALVPADYVDALKKVQYPADYDIKKFKK